MLSTQHLREQFASKERRTALPTGRGEGSAVDSRSPGYPRGTASRGPASRTGSVKGSLPSQHGRFTELYAGIFSAHLPNRHFLWPPVPMLTSAFPEQLLTFHHWCLHSRSFSR